MATAKQQLGDFGEKIVTKECLCPKCKRIGTLKKLIANFKCADIICEFCGYLAQVKTHTRQNITTLPKTILGAAWGPQKERMDAGIYFPLFIVTTNKDGDYAIYYLPADYQVPDMFIPRNPLRETARRARWQGFYYDLTKIKSNAILRLK